MSESPPARATPGPAGPAGEDAPVALLVNPRAGAGRAGRAADAAEAALRGGGMAVQRVSGADPAGAAQALAAALAAGVAAVVAVGGDGTVHLALQALAGTGVPLGIVAAGGGNDIAASLGGGAGDPAAAAAALLPALRAGRTRPVDLARAGDTWFAGVLCSGFDSLVNARANRMSWPRGSLRYTLAVLLELPVFRPRPFRLDVDGELVETTAMMVAVGNGDRYGGGMRITPAARMDDGLLDVTVVGQISRPELLRVFPRVYRGSHLGHPAVRTLRGRVVSVDAPDVPAYADGEYLAPLPVRCESVPGALTVLQP